LLINVARGETDSDCGYFRALLSTSIAYLGSDLH